MQISWNFQNACCKLKIKPGRENSVWIFHDFNYEKNYDGLKELILSMSELEPEVLETFQKIFRSQGDLELNISWPSNFVENFFMAKTIIFTIIFNK